MSDPEDKPRRHEREGWVFIGYKVENANEARCVAELLMMGGVPTWFAEYRIPADERFDTEEYIAHAIDEGVQGATAAIFLTNNRWADSDWCRREAIALLAGLLPGRIVEIQIPPEEGPSSAHPQIRRIPERNRWVHNGRAVDLAHFLNGLGWFAQTLVPAESVRPGTGRREELRFGLTLDWGALILQPDEGPQTARAQQAYAGDVRRFSGVVDGLKVSALVATRPYDTATRIDSIAAFGRHEDEMVHRHYRELARTYASDLEGTHLFFRNGRGQLAITCRQPDRAGVQILERRYLIAESRVRPCPFCGQTKLVPYEKRQEPGKGVIRLACDTCGRHEEISLDELEPKHLEECTNCAPRLHTNISVLEPEKDVNRWLCCLNPACARRFSLPGAMGRQASELHLSFAVAIGESSPASAIEQFLRIVPAFDAVARSIEWKPHSIWRDLEWIGASALRLLAFALVWMEATRIGLYARGTIGFKAAWWAAGIVSASVAAGAGRHRAVVSLALRGQQWLSHLLPGRTALVSGGAAFGVGADLLLCALAASPFAALMTWAGWQRFPAHEWFWLASGFFTYLVGAWLNERRT
jgi:hypothetical protein